MGNGDKTILITGATGRQGGAAIRHLLPKGWKLRALTRNPNGYTAKQLSGQGIEIVQGDLKIRPPWNEPRAVFMASTAFRISGPSASGAKSNKAKTWRISPRKRGLPISSTAPSVGPSVTPAFVLGKPSGKSKSIFGFWACRRPFSGRRDLWKSTTCWNWRLAS